jgi:hypothetical protein
VLPRETWARARLRAARGQRPGDLVVELPSAPPHALEVSCIVFSKDRPMQLEACLRTIIGNAPYRGSVTVIHRATSATYRRGYEMLDFGERVEMVDQGADFRSTVVGVLREVGEFVVFHTDDDLFFRRTPHAPLPPAGCAAFSLRLGENTDYSYSYGREQPLPERSHLGEVMIWNWRRAADDFAYPLSLNGHIFRTDLIRSLVRGVRFRDPNELERELHLRRHKVPALMASFMESSVVSIPVNVVTESIVNRSGDDPGLSAEALADRFLAGERINVEAIDFSAIRSAHQELALAFSRVELNGEA